MSLITSKSLLAEVAQAANQQGGVFSTYDELEDTALEITKRHMGELPPGYSYLKLLQWGELRRFITPHNGQGFRVSLEPDREKVKG